MKLILTFLSILVLYSNASFSKQHLCERTRLETLGFKDKEAAESWYPKKISITTNMEMKIATIYNEEVDLWIREDNKRMQTSIQQKMSEGHNVIQKYVFLPNGEVHSEISPVVGFAHAGGAVYKCTNWKK
jgi:hypothetical protein